MLFKFKIGWNKKKTACIWCICMMYIVGWEGGLIPSGIPKPTETETKLCWEFVRGKQWVMSKTAAFRVPSDNLVWEIIRKQASKRPCGPFGAKPTRASAFIGVYTFDWLRKPSVFGIRGTPRGSPRTPKRIGAIYTIECRCPCGHREARQGFGVH